MKLKLEIKANFDQLDTLCSALESLQKSLMCTDRQMFEIVLMLEELVANVIRHGRGRVVEIELEKEWDELEIIMRDDGQPFDPTRVAAVNTTAPLQDRCAGGLGLHLVRHYADSFTYRREDGKNVVMVKKKI